MKELFAKQLILKEIRKEHLPQIFDIWSDVEAGQYMYDTHWASVDELNVVLEANNDDDYYGFAAFLSTSGHEHDKDYVVATCRISLYDDGEWEIGYNVRKNHWGKGFATEMVQTLVAFAKELGATAVVTSVAQANAASCRVLEKCGFVVERESSFTKKSTDIVFVCNDYRYYMS